MTLRTMTRSELDLLLDWAAGEGWNPGLDDAAPFHAADPEGFFVALRGGAPVAAISVVNHDPTQAFLGLYICRPDWRGKGVGLELWTHALAHAGARTVGLDGVPAQQGNYARSGFLRAGGTTRWQGRLAGRADARVRVAMPDDLPALVALDRDAVGHGRFAFLTAWLSPTPARRTLVMEGSDGIAGFATIRLCRSGAKLGPVIAPDPGSGLALIRAAATEIDEDALSIDVPDGGPLGPALAAEGFTPGFSTARMYRGPAPRRGPTLQAVATLELG